MNSKVYSIAPVGALVIVAVMLSFARCARAHDWYPIECCHSVDCAPVDKVEIIPALNFAYAGETSTASPQSRVPSVMIVTTAKGSAIVPPTLPRRESPDGRMHACITSGRPAWSVDHFDTRPVPNDNQVVCIFMPPSN